jgi:(E)-4-hydroxy-3-methylbut-2-enyl-diphosphate synthase
MINRRPTRSIKIGRVFIGQNSPILVQSMCNTDTTDIGATVAQINELAVAGCEIVRVAVPSIEAAKALGPIKKEIELPLVADIHFSDELAVESIKQGVDKVRINPGNIGSKEKTTRVVKLAQEKNIPIRIGINAGSLEKDILKKYHNQATPEGMVESALNHIKILEDLNFYQIVISLKASDIERTVRAYELLAEQVDYPFHLGITEAGPTRQGTVVSAIGIGQLLSQGLGDTIRVSLTGNPVEEVRVAWDILKALKIRKRGVQITSCPTCGRTEMDLISLVAEVERATEQIDKDVHVAIMGCIVNGPGEAREADLALIAGKDSGLIIRKGKIVKRLQEKDLVKALISEIEQF